MLLGMFYLIKSFPCFAYHARQPRPKAPPSEINHPFQSIVGDTGAHPVSENGVIENLIPQCVWIWIEVFVLLNSGTADLCKTGKPNLEKPAT